MMRTAVLALLLCLLGQELSAAPAPEPVYDIQYKVTDRDATKPGDQPEIIRYMVKKPIKPKADSPVFYGIGVEGTAEDLKAKFTFFDKQFKDLGSSDTITPSVVFVEHRYFGKSKANHRILNLADLTDLKLDNVINDHVAIIKQLSVDLMSTNFFVFGGDKGGLVAGYVADKFATDVTLKDDYTVLAWRSSPPIKYLRQSMPATPDLQEINKKVLELLRQPEAGCVDADIANLNNVFTAVKSLRTLTPTANPVIAALKLNPTPRTSAGAVINDDLKELAVFIRKQILKLTTNNDEFGSNGKALTVNRNLKKFCDAVKAFTPTAAFNTLDDAKLLNDILAVFAGNANPIQWKLKPVANGEWNPALAASYYQDCTEYQLVYCPTTTNAATTVDPFKNAFWDADVKCDTANEWAPVIDNECKGLFGSTLNTIDFVPPASKYPLVLTKNVITTIDKQSLYGGVPNSHFDASDKNEKQYATFWELWGTPQWEFGDVRQCDSAKLTDVRYLILRVFGCLTGFVNNNKMVCDTATLFNDDADNNKKPYDDTPPNPNADCPAETDPMKAKFPFTHAKVIIQNPNAPVIETSTPTSTSTTRTSTPTIRTSTVKQGTMPPTTTASDADSGAGSLSATFVLVSSVLLWFGTL